MIALPRALAAIDLRGTGSAVAIVALDWTDDGPLYVTVDAQGITGSVPCGEVQVVDASLLAIVEYARQVIDHPRLGIA